MDEYIKREDAVSAICFGCNLEFSDRPCEPPDCEIRHAIEAIRAADVVPVVRCKECEYASPSTFPTAGKEWLSCQYGIKTVAVKATHFCSYGRKKDEITKTTDS